MPLLCLDTATDHPVAVTCTRAGVVLAGEVAEGRAQAVLACIDRVLEGAGIERNGIEAVVVGVGPGTFTGLRVGVAMARGIAEALGVPLFGVSSLEVVARAAGVVDGAVTAAIPAGRGECFVQAFEPGDGGVLVPLGDAAAVPAGDAPAPVAPTPHALARAAAARVRAADSDPADTGDPARVVPAYGREPDAVPPRMDVAIDALGAHDLDALVALEQRCFAAPWTEAMYRGELDRPAGHAVRLAARDRGTGGRLVGAALAARIADSWHVMNVLVDPAARGRGIAGRLVAELLDRTRVLGPGEGWTLEVRDGNEHAIRLYESAGFEHVGRRPGYYADTGEAAIVMWRYATDSDRAAVHA